MFGTRELLMRARTLFTASGRQPVMMAHMTDSPCIGYLGFFDFWYDGENGGFLTKQQEGNAAAGKAYYDFVDRYYNPTGMANLRITLGRQWGVMPQYHFSFGDDATFAVLGQFDLSKGYRPFGSRVAVNFPLQAEDTRFLPYWDVQKSVHLAPAAKDVLVGTWTHKGMARFLVSNLGESEAIVHLQLNQAILKLPAGWSVVDEQTGESYPTAENLIGPVRVPRHGYRVLIASALEALKRPSRGGTLAPPEDRWLRFFCDDFSTLTVVPPPSAGKAPAVGSSVVVGEGLELDEDGGEGEEEELGHMKAEAQTAAALAAYSRGGELPTAIAQATGWHGLASSRIGRSIFEGNAVFDRYRGHLRIRTDTYHHALLRRTFHQDNCSVQIKIHEASDPYGPGYGPGLILYWDKGCWVRMRAGFERAGSKRVIYVDGSSALGALNFSGPALGWDNWVRIALHADSIKFHASTDGEQWHLVKSISRRGFKGAPAHLLLGHGAPGKSPFLQNDGYNEHYNYYSHFDDLIVARLKK